MKKKMKRLMAFLVSILLCVSCTAFAQESEEEIPTWPVADGFSDFTLSYAEVQNGPVDNNAFTIVDTIVDADYGTVVRVSANPFAEKSSPPFVDCFGLKKHKIDLAKYKYVSIDYKLITKSELECIPIFDIMNSKGAALVTGTKIGAAVPLEKDGEWHTACFNLGAGTTGNLGTDGLLQQFHFFPFGSTYRSGAMSVDDAIYIGDVTFSVLQPPALDGIIADGEKPFEVKYADFQCGAVDRNEHTIIENVEIDDRGAVVKINPNSLAEKVGNVRVDAFELSKYGVDFAKYKYVTMKYKFVTNGSYGSIHPRFNIMTGKGNTTLKKSVSVTSTQPLVPDGEWKEVSFNLGVATNGNLGSTGVLWQFHLFPFGSMNVKDMSVEDTLYIDSFVFSTTAPEIVGNYTISFDYGKSGFENPENIEAKNGEVIVLPEINAQSGNMTATEWYCENNGRTYSSSASFTVPEYNVKMYAMWKNPLENTNVKILSFADFQGGIVDRKDTGTIENIELEGQSAVKITPNISATTDTGILIDGSKYGNENINFAEYKSCAILYKYVSSRPIEVTPELHVLARQSFTQGTKMKAISGNLDAGEWSAALFDLTETESTFIEGVEPMVVQLHFLPFSYIRPTTMSSGDVIYITKMIFFKDEAESISYVAPFISGYTDGSFNPNGNMTRAEACTVLARLIAGSDGDVPAFSRSAFSDISAADWYAKYVALCEKNGLLSSFEGELLPNNSITRAEFVDMVYKMGLLSPSGKNGSFTDVPTDHRYYTVIKAAGESGLVNGYSNGDGTFSFKPDSTITRTEIVKVINNAYGRLINDSAVEKSGYSHLRFTDVPEDFWGKNDILAASCAHAIYKCVDGNEYWLPCEKYELPKTESEFAPDLELGAAKAQELAALRDKRISEIRSSDSSLEVQGTKYYVSNSGSDENDGLTPETAFATETKARTLVKSGDAILFERGGEWRTTLTAVGGVAYGAYGVGAKPIINANTEGDAADPAKWALVDGTSNIYRYTSKLYDVGNIILNKGEGYAERVTPVLSGEEQLIDGVPFNPTTSLKLDNTYAFIYDSVSGGAVNPNSVKGDIYLRCDKGNPGSVYESIELALHTTAIYASSGNTFDNLCVLYAGLHGIGAGNCKDLVISNCEIGWIGGGAQHFTNGNIVRLGNGTQVYGSCDGYTVKNCYIYQCYDAGASPQYQEGGTDECLINNVLFENNVIDKCIYNIEYFMGKSLGGFAERSMQNVKFVNNILSESGYGWGANPARSACIKGWDHYNKASDFVISGNVILNPYANAYHIGTEFPAWLPTLSGNIYVLRVGTEFLRYGAGVSTIYTLDGSAADVMHNTVGEPDCELYYLP